MTVPLEHHLLVFTILNPPKLLPTLKCSPREIVLEQAKNSSDGLSLCLLAVPKGAADDRYKSISSTSEFTRLSWDVIKMKQQGITADQKSDEDHTSKQREGLLEYSRGQESDDVASQWLSPIDAVVDFDVKLLNREIQECEQINEIEGGRCKHALVCL